MNQKGHYYDEVCTVLKSFGYETNAVHKAFSDSNAILKTMKNDTLDILQLDSLTKADKLPEYNKWIKTPIKDGDDNNVYEYSTLYDKTTGIIYTVKQIKHNQYVVQKKKTTAK